MREQDICCAERKSNPGRCFSRGTVCSRESVSTFRVIRLTGREYDVEIASSETIATFKQKIEDHDGVPPDQQRLLFDGLELEDERTVADYKLQNGSKITCVFKLRGD